MIDTPPEPDAFEKRLRFCCGFFFGVLVGGFYVLRESNYSAAQASGIIFAFSLLCGYLATRYGDAFWRGLF